VQGQETIIAGINGAYTSKYMHVVGKVNEEEGGGRRRR